MSELEGVLERELKGSVTNCVRGLAGCVRVRVAAARSRERQVDVVGQVELRQRMVEEIERRNPELKARFLRHLEVLVNAKVAVEEWRSRDVGPN